MESVLQFADGTRTNNHTAATDLIQTGLTGMLEDRGLWTAEEQKIQHQQQTLLFIVGREGLRNYNYCQKC